MNDDFTGMSMISLLDSKTGFHLSQNSSFGMGPLDCAVAIADTTSNAEHLRDELDEANISAITL